MFDISIAILGGFIAGVINTLAGNGSAITLTVLTEVLGLPPNVANGTNRIGILAQSVAGTYEFKKRGVLNLGASTSILFPFVIGAGLGVYAAVEISNEGFRQIFGALLIFLLLTVLVKPKRWLNPELYTNNFPSWALFILYVLLGFYGGFIQMGMGIFFLATLVLLSHYNITVANATKLFVVGIYTAGVLVVFQWKGLVDWEMGMIVAVGQALGGWLTAIYASKYKWMEHVAYYLLLAIIVMALIYFYELYAIFN